MSVRLWLHRRAVSDALGSHQGVLYLSYIAITLESASLYTVFTIVTLVTLALNNQFLYLFDAILGMIQVIVPALIINRIARGISFEKDKDWIAGDE